jgi:stage V sporulation protein G
MVKEATTAAFLVQRLIKFDGDGSLKAFCDLVIGDLFVIKGLRVVNGRKGLFVSMPRHQGKDTKWYDMVEPLTKEVKQEVDQIVLEAYQQAAQD